MQLARLLERTLRADGARLRAGLIRLAGDFDLAEDALQEACARALEAWPRRELPDNAGAWLNTVARRIVLDRIRRDRLVPLSVDFDPPDDSGEFDCDVEEVSIPDDRLRLLFTCCHPAIAQEHSVALALRTLCGLTTREIARAFLTGEAAMAQRIVRAKRKIRSAGIAFEIPRPEFLEQRLDAVLAVIYLVFNEGYAATEREGLTRPDLCNEAIRLGRLATDLMPEQPEVSGLLALMLLIEARHPARRDRNGLPVLLSGQDRTRWDRDMIREGTRLLDQAIHRRRPGPFQIQAAIAALHAEAGGTSDTDWRQILLLYRRLLTFRSSPVIELNAAVALAMVDGPESGLAWIDRIDARGDLDRYHLLHAARAELLRELGRVDDAIDAYQRALDSVANKAEYRWLKKRLSELQAQAHRASGHD